MAPTACASLPAFPLQILLRRHPGWRGLPAAVVDEDKPLGRLLWVNEEARVHRVLPGMRYAAGLSLARELRAGVVSPEEIAAEIDDLAGRLRFYTPEVEPSRVEPGIFWLNPKGLDLLVPSLQRWGGLVLEEIARAGFLGAVAVGFSRFGTYATAKATRMDPRRPSLTLFTDPREERTRVRQVPIDRLGIEPEVRDALLRLGIERLGGFLDLPPQGIRRRFGEPAARLYQVAQGDGPEEIVPEIPEDPLIRSVLLDQPESDTGRLLYTIEGELAALLDRLREKDLDLTELSLRLVLDRYRQVESSANGADRCESLRPARPTRDLRQLLDLIRLRLDALELPRGVIELHLEVRGIAAGQEQNHLFTARPGRDLKAAERALARVRAEFGDLAVVRAERRDGHLPEARFSWEPCERLKEADPRKVWMPPLVRRLLGKPLPVVVRHREGESVQYGHDVQSGQSVQCRQVQKSGPGGRGEPDGPEVVARGPYLFSGGWWRTPIQREYRFSDHPDGGWVWGYYDARRKRWFVQGRVE